jgi:hypothetical protein
MQQMEQDDRVATTGDGDEIWSFGSKSVAQLRIKVSDFGFGHKRRKVSEAREVKEL